ncbi:YbhN family protein [Pseudoduganella sp. GCM10020061]|uniref:lysylphosphatidylglycerol synthase transmembrane domain-containing protein n=1 Tax=Pseudoduganella sp. GCM10020061 TaxID=3317345 RepID=UPI003642BB60
MRLDDFVDRRTDRGNTGRRAPLRIAFWLSWLIGGAALAALIVVALELSEERALWRLAESAQPWWMAVAVLVQAATYLAQGEVWRVVARAGGSSVSMPVAFKLSLAQLFIDQALPSGGISGAVFVIRSLERRGVPRAVVMASLLVDRVAYHGAYALALCLAIGIALMGGEVSPLILALAAFLSIISVLLTGVAVLAARGISLPAALRNIRLLGKILSLLGEADPALMRNLPLMMKSTVLQLMVIALDAATVWILIRSLGETATASGVFVSFMAASLLRTISIIPGGLGVFEATSVLALQHSGTSIPVALGATMLFRGLSFWLPMLPGIVFSRGAGHATM